MPRPFANWRQKLGVGGSNKHTAYEAKPTDETGGEDNSPVPVTEETPLVSSQTVSFEKDQQEVPASNSVRFAQNGEDVYGQGGVFSDSIRSISERISEFARQLSEAVEEHTGSIGYLGSFAIAVNSLTGPAMLELPAAFAESGLIPTTFTLLFVCFLSASCSLYMANSISRVPVTKQREYTDMEEVGGLNSDGVSHKDADQTPAASKQSSGENGVQYNHDFKAEVEFSAVFSTFWGYHPWFHVTHLLFWGCITCLNISSIVDTSQVVDTILGHCIGSWALQVGWGRQPHLVGWDARLCSDEELSQGECLPFRPILMNEEDDGTYLLTVGMLITSCAFLPMALMDLKENAGWQISGFIVLLLTSLQFVIQFAMEIFNPSSDAFAAHDASGLPEERPSWYSEEALWGKQWDDLFGVVLFNFALVIAVPAWLYEREPHVDVPTVIYGSSFLSTFLYIAIGWLGNLAVPHVSSNFLASLMSGMYGHYMQFGASVFAFFIVGLGIPLFSVLTRLNLIGESPDAPALLQRPMANVLAVYVPFGASWFLYDGHAITKLLSWGGIIFTSIVAFILPLFLALHVSKLSSDMGSVTVFGHYFTSQSAQTTMLRVLLILAFLSIALAILGNII
mmetsp:Transcript_9674/g.20875  ORF Transcript_9674/g.20875 Transcript_9674/m.20875 type:complete len:622 (-) Transcript_9674:1504-3369(-)